MTGVVASIAGITAATWAGVGAAATVVGAGVSAYGALSQGSAASGSYQSQAEADKYNATVARNNARAASDQANFKEEQQHRKFAQLQGEALAAIGQSGTGLDGSNLDVLHQNAVNNQLDALTIRYEGQQQASGLLAQSQMSDLEAKQARKNASTAKFAGYVGAGASLLSGAGQAAYYMNGGIKPAATPKAPG